MNGGDWGNMGLCCVRPSPTRLHSADWQSAVSAECIRPVCGLPTRRVRWRTRLLTCLPTGRRRRLQSLGGGRKGWPREMSKTVPSGFTICEGRLHTIRVTTVMKSDPASTNPSHPAGGQYQSLDCHRSERRQPSLNAEGVAGHGWHELSQILGVGEGASPPTEFGQRGTKLACVYRRLLRSKRPLRPLILLPRPNVFKGHSRPRAPRLRAKLAGEKSLTPASGQAGVP